MESTSRESASVGMVLMGVKCEVRGGKMRGFSGASKTIKQGRTSAESLTVA